MKETSLTKAFKFEDGDLKAEIMLKHEGHDSYVKLEILLDPIEVLEEIAKGTDTKIDDAVVSAIKSIKEGLVG